MNNYTFVCFAMPRGKFFRLREMAHISTPTLIRTFPSNPCRFPPSLFPRKQFRSILSDPGSYYYLPPTLYNHFRATPRNLALVNRPQTGESERNIVHPHRFPAFCLQGFSRSPTFTEWQERCRSWSSSRPEVNGDRCTV